MFLSFSNFYQSIRYSSHFVIWDLVRYFGSPNISLSENIEDRLE